MPPTPSGWSPTEPPLAEAALTEAAGPSWSVRLLPEAESTNAAAAAAPRAGLVVVADHQTAGRGRLDRSWDTPPGTALTFSAVADPSLSDEQWPLVPLAAALAVADGVRRAADVDPQLKWPNDLLLTGDRANGKFCGILLERVANPADPARALAVIGIGINVGMTQEQLPVPTATSLAIAGASVGRTEVFGQVLRALSSVVTLLGEDPSAVLERYRSACTTLGRHVEVHLPDGSVVTGRADDVDEHGRLVVDGLAIAAGDVVHVRPGVT